MTHFLGRLVERARGTAPRVEPIIAPRFAPALVAEIASEIEMPAASQEKEGAPRNGAPVDEVVRQKIDSPSPAETGREEIDAPKPERLLVPQEIVVSHPASSIVRRIVPADVAVPPMTNGATSGQSVTEAPATRPGSAPPATRGRVVAGIADPARAGRVVAGGVDPARSAIFPNESKSDPPIVRVTIGRIEVRAASAPPAAPRKSAPRSEPKLTLDAYLKARKEGAR